MEVGQQVLMTAETSTSLFSELRRRRLLDRLLDERLLDGLLWIGCGLLMRRRMGSWAPVEAWREGRPYGSAPGMSRHQSVLTA